MARPSTISWELRRLASTLLWVKLAFVDAPLEKICLLGCGVTTGVGAPTKAARVEFWSRNYWICFSYCLCRLHKVLTLLRKIAIDKSFNAGRRKGEVWLDGCDQSKRPWQASARALSTACLRLKLKTLVLSSKPAATVTPQPCDGRTCMLSHVRCSMETSIPLEAHAANWRLKGGGGGGVNLAIYKAAGDEATRRHKKAKKHVLVSEKAGSDGLQAGGGKQASKAARASSS
ncbi:hypothetical protein SELMODRAFT_415986 [Selaginella moellendorffii]|uniref:Uncharacterized protein n=1 Tax=Selaginella moellendorffii TaxID=88036 RepID=D8RXQ5_SELML|nr:hypothetical protein SELMODRAFT_415986 [Selaginella moellendorffii]